MVLLVFADATKRKKEANIENVSSLFVFVKNLHIIQDESNWVCFILKIICLTVILFNIIFSM